MLNLSTTAIYLALEPTDLRKSFDTLAALVRDHLDADPLSGAWLMWPSLSPSPIG